MSKDKKIDVKEAVALRAAAIDFAKNLNVAPVDYIDTYGRRRNEALLKAAKVYAKATATPKQAPTSKRAKMHPDVRALNRSDPPPKGYKHPAYEVYGRDSHWSLSYLNGGLWNMPIRTFPSEASALRWLLNVLYYGPREAIVQPRQDAPINRARVEKQKKPPSKERTRSPWR